MARALVIYMQCGDVMRSLIAFVAAVSAALVARHGVAQASEPRVAIAVNAPLTWGVSFGGSIFVGVAERQAIRANVATSDTWDQVPAGLFGADIESYYKRTFDLGLGWVFYPIARFRGLSLELGMLNRKRQVYDGDPFDGDNFTLTDTRTYAARGLIGYSWILADHVFVATAIGASAGYARGSRTISRSMDSSSDYGVTTEAVSTASAELEAYLRFGFTL